MSTQNIIIIVAFFAVSFLLMIPFAMWYSKKKKAVSAFSSQNRHQAVLRIYGEKVAVDGTPVNKHANFLRGDDLDYIVALPPGEHKITAKYSASQPSLGKNVNYTTPKPIETIINLEAGNEYTLSMYFYSPEQRFNYYEGDVGKTVYSQALQITGSGFGGFQDAYIICYLENPL